MNNKLAIYIPPLPKLKNYCDIIDFTYSHGLNSVEAFSVFDFENPDIENARRIKAYADEKGIKIPCFSVYATISDDIELTKERLKAYADVAAVLGSPYLHHTIVGEFDNYVPVLDRKDELFNAGIEVVREVFDYAETKGIRTIYEEQGFIFNGVKNFGEFLEKVNRNVGVVADFGNIYQSGDTIEDFINAFHDRIVHAHIKNFSITDEKSENSYPALNGKFINETEIDKGIVDGMAVIKLLRSYGYDGYYGLEYSVDDDNSPLVERAINIADSWLNLG